MTYRPLPPGGEQLVAAQARVTGEARQRASASGGLVHGERVPRARSRPAGTSRGAARRTRPRGPRCLPSPPRPGSRRRSRAEWRCPGPALAADRARLPSLPPGRHRARKPTRCGSEACAARRASCAPGRQLRTLQSRHCAERSRALPPQLPCKPEHAETSPLRAPVMATTEPVLVRRRPEARQTRRRADSLPVAARQPTPGDRSPTSRLPLNYVPQSRPRGLLPRSPAAPARACADCRTARARARDSRLLWFATAQAAHCGGPTVECPNSPDFHAIAHSEALLAAPLGASRQERGRAW